MYTGNDGRPIRVRPLDTDAPSAVSWLWRLTLWAGILHTHQPRHYDYYDFWWCRRCAYALCHQPWTAGPEWVPYTDHITYWKRDRWRAEFRRRQDAARG